MPDNNTNRRKKIIPRCYTPEINTDGSERLHYDDPDFQMFCHRNFIRANEIFPGMTIHWHADIEFIYVAEGCVSYQLNDKKVLMKAGEGIFVNSGQLHLIISENSDCILYCLIFHPMLLCSSKHIENKYVAPVIRNDAVPYLMLSESIPWQKEILQHICSLYHLSQSGSKEMEMMKTLFELWNVLFCNLDMSEHKTGYYGGLDAIRQMIRFIHDEYKNKITLDDLCRAGGVGRTNCSKLFEKYVSSTPIDYVISYRITKSTALLLNTDLSITQIALESGFSSASFFTETFRKKIGLTPQEFRKERKPDE